MRLEFLGMVSHALEGLGVSVKYGRGVEMAV